MPWKGTKVIVCGLFLNNPKKDTQYYIVFEIEHQV